MPENMLEPPLSGRVGRCCSLSTEPPGSEALYVTADVTLDNHQRVIVMEKGPLPSPTAGLQEEGGEDGGQGPETTQYPPKEEGPRDSADASQRGRVRNLRQKFQALNSIG